MTLVAIVFCGGLPAPPEVAVSLPVPDLVVAADSGYRDAQRLGVRVDVLVGDLDSITEADLAHAQATGVAVERHRPDKDATDLELALDSAVERGAARVTVVSGGGGRLDHLLGTAGLLGSARFAAVTLEAWIGEAHLRVVHGPGSARLDAQHGELLTLLPAGAAARGVTTAGLLYPLRGETLHAGETRGVSNVVDDVHSAGVSLDSGTLLAIRPHALVRTKETP